MLTAGGFRHSKCQNRREVEPKGPQALFLTLIACEYHTEEVTRRSQTYNIVPALSKRSAHP
jgi:hypothetical protein